jgi:hypothetical protein
MPFFPHHNRDKMFNRSRQKRFAIVAMFPLLLMGIWLFNGGVKRFVRSHYIASCTDGKCSSFAADEASNPADGIYLDSPFGNGARLEGNLVAWIVRDGAADREFLSIPAQRADGSACSLTYSEKMEQMANSGGKLTTVGIIKDVFSLQCGTASIATFRFADRDVQIALVNQLIENADNRALFYLNQRRIALALFFAPFLAFGLIWIVVLLLRRVLNFVWTGSAKDDPVVVLD